LQKYTIIRTDRPNSKQSGGTAIAIRNNIKHEVISHPSSVNNSTIEFTIIKLLSSEDQNGKTFIVSIYATPDNKKVFIDELNNLFIKLNLSNPNNSFIIAGDLNSRRIDWGDSSTNERGKYLIRWEKELAPRYQTKIFATNGPSYTPNNSYLDCCITNLTICDLTNNKIQTVDYDSDHRALLFTVQLRSTIQLKQVIKKFNFKATNWSQFSKFLAKNCNPSPPDDRNLSNTEIDYLVETTTKSIREAIVSTVPQFKKQDKELRKEFSKSITCYWSNQLRQVNHRDPNAFFPKINRMLRPKQNIEIANQIIKSDSDLITNKTILQKLPNKSSSGPDELPSIVLKHLPDNLIHTITILFNNALNNAYFPKAWKEAKVLPLLKKKQRSN
ncbi:GSCOCG00004376001-RA-CDS, partial [Cotesia congregata]